MAWNEPGNNNGNNNGRDDKDPWGNNNNGGNKNSGGRDQGPPDLDEVFNKLSQKLGGKFGKSGGSGNGSSGAAKGFMGLIIVVLAIVWGVSGFYTINTTDRGVVLHLGKFEGKIAEPGLNWLPRFIDRVTPVDVKGVRTLGTSGAMLTRDENVVMIAMEVQYKVSDPYKYLYNVTSADDSLRQAMDSALRAVIGDSLMDSILTTGRPKIRQETREALSLIINNYDMGLAIVDVNFQSARPPEQVKDAFDDAIAAREDEERFKRHAEAYRNEIKPKADGRAERLEKDADGYAERTINEALGQVARFEKLLPEYQAAPGVTRERLYLDAMEEVYTSTSKVLIDSESSGNLLYLPIDKLGQSGSSSAVKRQTETTSALNEIELEPQRTETSTRSSTTSRSTTRSTTTRQGRY